jgi:predicted nuclease with TOPRIM domain
MSPTQRIEALTAELNQLDAEADRLTAALEVVRRRINEIKGQRALLQREVDRQEIAALEVPAEALTGQALLEKIVELGDVSKMALVRACGYVSRRDDGGERLEFSNFYEQLCAAKGLNPKMFCQD